MSVLYFKKKKKQKEVAREVKLNGNYMLLCSDQTKEQKNGLPMISTEQTVVTQVHHRQNTKFRTQYYFRN
jgi:hypothetical protein